MSNSHDHNLLTILSNISKSLKDVEIKNRYDFEEIKSIYKKAVFEIKDEALLKEDNLFSSKLTGDNAQQLLDLYSHHSCCWVNYIGCDSFSKSGRQQVFFSSIIMEVEDENLNRTHLASNNAILRLYNNMIEDKVPADIFVQLFFLDQKAFEERLCKENCNDLIPIFRRIRENGLAISFDSKQVVNSDKDIIESLSTDVEVKSVSLDSIESDLRITKDEKGTIVDEAIGVLKRIRSNGTPLSPLVQKVIKLNRSLHPEAKMLFFIPAGGADGAVGLICYGAKGELSEDEINDQRLLGYNILFPFVSAYKSAWESDRIKNESIKAAVSAIMSRNMSHNLGSHCMHYTRATLDSLADSVSGHGPEIRGAARLLGYIQARMDFLATLVSGEEYPYGSVNFKSQILDILTVDDFSRRHYSSSEPQDKYNIIEKTGIKGELTKLVDVLNDIDSSKDKRRDTVCLEDAIYTTEDLISNLDKLPLDNARLRTTNFLLDNLIKSEHFFREGPGLSDNDRRFRLQVRYEDNLFTGVAIDESRLNREIGDLSDLISYFNSLKSDYQNNSIHSYLLHLEKKRKRDNYVYQSDINDYSSRLQEEINLFQKRKEECEYLLERMPEENRTKEMLSDLNLAMPGGIMSSHAFFNILENLIRNSAKHNISDLKERDLITTVDIRKTNDSTHFQFTIFDNKKDAKTVLPIIQRQLKELTILNEADSTINKQSKGLKEMLVAALWLRAIELNSTYSKLLREIERIPKEGKIIDGKVIDRSSLIGDYAYQLVSVDDNGCDSVAEDSNFGIRFNLPRFCNRMELIIEDNQAEDDLTDIVSTIKKHPAHADIIEISQKKYYPEASKRFPRLYLIGSSLTQKRKDFLLNSVVESYSSTQNRKDNRYPNLLPEYVDVKELFCILTKRFGRSLVDYRIVFDEKGSSKVTDCKNIIYFRRHFNHGDDFSSGKNYLYADSVSGGNFTVTMQENFMKGHCGDGRCKTWKDKYFELKIMESALTRITIIDERLSDGVNGDELSMKNIRVLNLNYETANESDLWYGNSFMDNDEYTLFLTIHLGLIEKVIGNDNGFYMQKYQKESCKEEKASFFMNELRKKFGKNREIFISIHSGRGNYSYELDHSLKQYPFINLTAIESVFSNSKYLLSQLFYNTVFIGKGDYNNK